MTDPADIIEIRDPEIDVAKIMEKIREGIAKRQALYEQDVFFPSFRESVSSGAFGAQLGQELDYHLREALATHDQVWVSRQVVPVHTPILGGFLTRLKGELHNLVVFYVNLLAAKQVSFNAHAARAISALSEIVATTHAASEVEQLRQEVRELAERVSGLEGELRSARGNRQPEEEQGG